MAWYWIGILSVVLLFVGCDGGSTCYYGFSKKNEKDGVHSREKFHGSIYCSSGCCGYYEKQKCCDSEPIAAIIAGSILAGLLLIAIVAGIITCCFHFKNQPKVVVNPENVIRPGEEPINIIEDQQRQNAGIYPEKKPQYKFQAAFDDLPPPYVAVEPEKKMESKM